MFCNKTNKGLGGVSLNKFPDDEPRRRQWIAFVLAKRDDNWTPGSGHIWSTGARLHHQMEMGICCKESGKCCPFTFKAFTSIKPMTSTKSVDTVNWKVMQGINFGFNLVHMPKPEPNTVIKSFYYWHLKWMGKRAESQKNKKAYWIKAWDINALGDRERSIPYKLWA